MFERIGPEFQCLEREGDNYNVWKDRARIPMFARIKPGFQYLEG